MRSSVVEELPRKEQGIVGVKTTRQAKGLPSPEQVRAKDILSPEEVAVVLGCGRTMAYHLISSSEIPSFQIGRLRRIRRIDVERFVEERVDGGQKA
jgi:excisionase family DNA binding protein